MRSKNVAYKFSIIMLIVFSYGCASDVPRMPKYDSHVSYNPQTAIIVVNPSNVSYVDINKYNPNSSKQDDAFYNKTSNKVDVELDRSNAWRLYKQALSIATPFNYSRMIYAIEPGIYYIAFAYNENNALPNFTRDPGVSPQGEIMYGAFEIKPSTVVYLGDVDFNWLSTSKVKRLKIINNITMVQKDLKAAGYDKLASQLEMANFYPRGSRITVDQDGVLQISAGQS